MNAMPEDLLKPLRGMYLAQLRERVESAEAFLAHCRVGSVPENERSLMAGLAHKLAGSGTTYGFPMITQSARALEEALQTVPPVEGAILLPLAESLVHACGQALLMTERDSADASVRAAAPPPAALKPVMLAVDDDPVIRDTLAALFGRDFEVVTARDGLEGLALATERNPRLILVDQSMPQMTGVEFVESLRKAHNDVPIIMITAENTPQDVVRALAAGVTDYILKPFKTEDVAAKVRDLLRRSGRTVLIADDDPAIRDLLAYKFRLAGVRVITAADGEEAWRMASEYLPRLAILDRMMPGLDGVAVLQKMRERAETRDIPVIFLTALRQEKDILEGFRIGVSDYVIKPFLPEEVLARGLRLLGLEKGAEKGSEELGRA
jgi:DNA-binding response OmpR family regulator/HPt (histidine-containing phosphotransfer) domain-containing protein